jgi:hypothetical protein
MEADLKTIVIGFLKNVFFCKNVQKIYSGYNKKEKRTNNDLQNITQKTKDRVTRIPLRVMLDQIIYNKIYHNTAV